MNEPMNPLIMINLEKTWVDIEGTVGTVRSVLKHLVDTWPDTPGIGAQAHILEGCESALAYLVEQWPGGMESRIELVALERKCGDLIREKQESGELTEVKS